MADLATGGLVTASSAGQSLGHGVAIGVSSDFELVSVAMRVCAVPTITDPVTVADRRWIGAAISLVASEPTVVIVLEHCLFVGRAAAATRSQGAVFGESLEVRRHATKRFETSSTFVRVTIVGKAATPGRANTSYVDLPFVALTAAIATETVRMVTSPPAASGRAVGRTTDLLAVVMILPSTSSVVPADYSVTRAASVRQSFVVIKVFTLALVLKAVLPGPPFDTLCQRQNLTSTNELGYALQGTCGLYLLT